MKALPRGTIFLDFSENTFKIEQEEQSRFIRYILEECGVPIAPIWGDDQPLSAKQKINLRNLLSTYNLQIIDHQDGTLQIFLEQELIASWHKPKYVLKKDPSNLIKTKRLYLEMTLYYYSVFDEDFNTDTESNDALSAQAQTQPQGDRSNPS